LIWEWNRGGWNCIKEGGEEGITYDTANHQKPHNDHHGLSEVFGVFALVAVGIHDETEIFLRDVEVEDCADTDWALCLVVEEVSFVSLCFLDVFTWEEKGREVLSSLFSSCIEPTQL